MKKRKKNSKVGQKTVNSMQTNETIKPKKDLKKMNLFERMAYLNEMCDSSKVSEIKQLRNATEKAAEERNFTIDEENWEKLYEACGKCVRYCKQKKGEESKDEKKEVLKSSKKKGSSKGRKCKIDLEKLKIFLKANAQRKVTKTEVTEFCGVSSFSRVRAELKKLTDFEEYFSYIIDLRKDSLPKGKLIIPGEGSENKSVIDSVECDSALEDLAKKSNPVAKTQNDDKPKKVVITSFFELTSEEIKAITGKEVDVEKIDNKGLEQPKSEGVPIVESDTESKHNTENIVELFDIEPGSSESTPSIKSEVTSGSEKTSITEDLSVNQPGRLKPVAKVRQLFNLRKLQSRNFVFDKSIFELNDLKAYEIIVNEVFQNCSGVLWISLNQFYTLDRIKKDCCVAQELLKTIALDDGSHIKLIEEEISEGEQLASFCKANDLTLVSGFPVNVIWCKAKGVDVVVPNYFKKMCPSPFKGDEIIGVDSNLLIDKKTQYVFEKAKIVWISDYQLREVTVENTDYWAEIAYYANFDRAENLSSNHPDTNHLTFFKSKNVDKVYSADYGFIGLAKFMKIPAEVVYTSNLMKEASKSIMLDLFKKQRGISTEKMKKVLPGKIVSLNAISEITEKQMRVFSKINDVGIFVYDSRRRPKRSLLRFIEVSKGDEILIQEGAVVLIVKIINTGNALGEVIYYGDEKDLPANLIFIK